MHTKYSRCCPFEYDLFNIFEKIVNLGANYCCVSDHIHFDGDDGYFPNHLEVIKKIREIRETKENYRKKFPIFLGAELTILNEEGKLPQLTASKGNLDYFIVGDHFIPKYEITMDKLDEGRTILRNLMQKNPDRLKLVLNAVKNMYLNTIHRNNPTVLVHPFSTFLRCDFTHKQLIEDFESVCEACQETNTAIEINAAQVRDCVINPRPVLMEHLDMPDKSEFYHTLIKTSLKYDIVYSLGSDAHNLKDVGNLDPCLKIVDEFNIPQKKILNLLSNNGIHAHLC